MKRLKKSNKRTVGRRPKSGQGKSDTRVAILAAARRVFAQRGLDGTSVREVAAAANVNNAMIYYHFKGKDELYRSVLADSFLALAAIWNDDAFTSSAPVKQKISNCVENFIRYEQANENICRIMAMEFATSGGSIACICERYFSDSYARLIKIYSEGIKKGEMKKCNPAVAVASLFGVIVHNFIEPRKTPDSCLVIEWPPEGRKQHHRLKH